MVKSEMVFISFPLVGFRSNMADSGSCPDSYYRASSSKRGAAPSIQTSSKLGESVYKIITLTQH